MALAPPGYHRILVATDFSAHADAALKQAVWLARQAGASLTLSHTLRDLRRVMLSASAPARLDLRHGKGEQFLREVRISSDAKMGRIIAELAATDLEVRFETLLGEPFLELTHAVQAEGYDLVMAGTRGLSGFEQFLVGSTAKRLIRKCPSSVWVVKSPHVGPPKVVLAPVDFSPVSLKSAAHGLWVAQQAGAQFHLLHVIDSMDVPEDLISHIPKGSTLRQEINQEAQANLDAFLDSLACDRSSIHVHLSWGTPWKEVQRLAQQRMVDLIAMGTVGRSGIRGILMGNTAEKILATCDCSLLTVKPDDFVSPISPADWPLHPSG